MRSESRERDPEAVPPAPVPLTIVLPQAAKQLIISGPNTGGKTVSLKTLGLLALMAQAGCSGTGGGGGTAAIYQRLCGYRRCAVDRA